MARDTPEPAPTPAEPTDQKLARALIGYRRHDVDQALSEAQAGIQSATAEKAELTQRIEQLEAELARHQELAPLLQSTLISAERAADTTRQQAPTETDELLEEANTKARRLTATARAETEQLDGETHHLIALLRSALTILETQPAPTEEPAPDTLHDQIRRLSQ